MKNIDYTIKDIGLINVLEQSHCYVVYQILQTPNIIVKYQEYMCIYELVPVKRHHLVFLS